MPGTEIISLQESHIFKMPEATVLCLGNFDGVHVAHRTLLRKAKQIRDTRFPHAACGVLCFHGLSSDFLQGTPVPHLSDEGARLDAFREEGMDFAVLCDFPTVQHMSAEQFIDRILLDECHCVATVCGFNYRFGEYGAGTPETLEAHFGNAAHTEPAFMLDGAPVSSTRIRTCLLEGDAKTAATLLSHPYRFVSPVLHGKKLGRTIGIPTVNQVIPRSLLVPRHGVYITDCKIGDRVLRGVTNVGVHPTVDENAPVNCETYLLDFHEEIYGEEIELSFLRYLRPEEKFSTLEALRSRIALDIEEARNYK